MLEEMEEEYGKEREALKAAVKEKEVQVGWWLWSALHCRSAWRCLAPRRVSPAGPASCAACHPPRLPCHPPPAAAPKPLSLQVGADTSLDAFKEALGAPPEGVSETSMCA